MRTNNFGISGFWLKIIAIVTMAIDHIGLVFYPNIQLFRIIGRIAFPIFIFLLVEGAYHTRNIRKYELRLFLFALISEIPFDLAVSGVPFDRNNQNVFFTLAIGLVMIDLLQKHKQWFKMLFIILLCILAAEILATDYGMGGILLILLFYKFRDEPIMKAVVLAAISLAFYYWIEIFSLFALIPILLYNGKRGPSLKYAFYVFYPAHLFLIYLTAHIFMANGITSFFGGILS